MSETLTLTTTIPEQQYAYVQFLERGKDSYVGNTIYTFKSDIQGLKVGDYVVCDCSTGFAVGRVQSITLVDKNGKSTRWLVQKVDMETHRVRVEREYRRQEVRAKMDARRKHLEDMALYKMLADSDPEMAKLITEYYET